MAKVTLSFVLQRILKMSLLVISLGTILQISPANFGESRKSQKQSKFQQEKAITINVHERHNNMYAYKGNLYRSLKTLNPNKHGDALRC